MVSQFVIWLMLPIFALPITKIGIIDRWCNWQHAWFWSRRVEVRALVGQLKKAPNWGFFYGLNLQWLSFAYFTIISKSLLHSK